MILFINNHLQLSSHVKKSFKSENKTYMNERYTLVYP